MELEEAVQKLREELAKNPTRAKDEKEVIAKYSQMFKPENLEKLEKHDFKSFLMIKNNKHWEGIHRQGNMITQDMDKLKDALRILLDKNIPIKERLDILLPKNKPSFIKGLGRAVLTPMLFVVYPSEYGVYNSVCEAGMKELGLYPDFSGESFAERYVKVNEIINDVSGQYGLSLWQVDELWWHATTQQLPTIKKTQIEEKDEIENLVNFGLETHLEDFLIDNWENIPLGNKFDIYQDENGDAIGQQYRTKELYIGSIDILCTDKETNDFVVIELKKGKSSDTVVGQIMRYIGWVKQHLVKEGQNVRGIIIANASDDKLRYALLATNNVELLTYEVKFILK